MGNVVPLTPVLDEICSLLGQCAHLGAQMKEACHDTSDITRVGTLHRDRSRLLEEVESLVTQHTITAQVLESKLAGAQAVRQQVDVLLHQNQELETLISTWQQEVAGQVGELNAAQRANRAYGRWHPIRVLAERRD